MHNFFAVLSSAHTHNKKRNKKAIRMWEKKERRDNATKRSHVKCAKTNDKIKGTSGREKDSDYEWTLSN